MKRILESYSKTCFHFSDNFLRMVFPSAEPVHGNDQVTEQVETVIEAINSEVSA